MMEISHSCRAFLHKNGQVMIRVRWNNRKCEVGFSVGCNGKYKVTCPTIVKVT